MPSNSFIRLSKEAIAIAKEMGHAESTLAHLTIALLASKDYDLANFFNEKNVSVKDPDAHIKTLPISNDIRASLNVDETIRKIAPGNKDVTNERPEIGNAYTFALDFAQKTRGSTTGVVTGLDLLTAIAGMGKIPDKTKPFEILKKYGLSREVCATYAKNPDNVTRTTPDDETPEKAHSLAQSTVLQFKPPYVPHIIPTVKDSVLSKFAENLVVKAQEGKFSRIYGREKEIERVARIMAMKEAGNAFVIGESGEGKTALVEELARRIADGTAPASMLKKNIFAVNMANMVAGTKYRGQFEERMKGLIEEAKREGVILFFDEIHTIIGAGDAEGAMDATGILLPALARGEIHVLGTTTPDDRRKGIKNPAINRRFIDVPMEKLPVEESRKALLGSVKAEMENYHGVIMPERVLNDVITISEKLRNNRPLIAAVKRVMDETGAKFSSVRAEDDTTRPVLKLKDFEPEIAAYFKAPIHTVSKSEAKILTTLEDKLNSEIVSQREAASKLTAATFRARSGIANPDRPAGSFLFTGPTGVGKTEMVLSYARHMGLPVVRFDMGEFQEPNSSNRLTGAPPGYVGYEEGGELTNALDKTPRCVILFDEIEKAHKSWQKILLSMLTTGNITDSNGKTISCRHATIILTTNLGANKNTTEMGFASAGASAGKKGLSQEVLDYLRPEIIGRIGEHNVIDFNRLERADATKILEKFLKQRNKNLIEKHITITASAGAKELLVAEGFNEKYGARPMDQAIERLVETPISREIIAGSLRKGGTVSISTKSEGEKKSLSFAFKAAVAKRAANENEDAGKKFRTRKPPALEAVPA